MRASPDCGSVDASVRVLDPSCFLLKGALTLGEQTRLFDTVQRSDATDWHHMTPCMNPTPKTLEFFSQRDDGQTARFLSYRAPDDSNGSEVDSGGAVVDMVGKATKLLGWTEPVQSVSLAAIRYCATGSSATIGSCFPPHIDHCNDGTWVFLASVGCAARFHVKTPRMVQPHAFEMESGDVLVFDPSSEAAVLHGVAGVGGEESCGRELAERFEVLRSSRFGLQCRVSLGDSTARHTVPVRPPPPRVWDDH